MLASGSAGRCLHRSTELVASLLAIHRLGHVFVPMDPVLPEGRLSHILDDARPALVLTRRSLASSLAQHDTPFLCVDELRAGSPYETVVSPPLRCTVSPDAYVIYTSGTTGTPKGVEVSHEGVINQIQWRRQQFQIDCEDRILQTFALAFDPRCGRSSDPSRPGPAWSSVRTAMTRRVLPRVCMPKG